MPWTVAAFQQNRRTTWKAIRWWIVLLVVSVIGFQIPFWINRDKVDISGSEPGHYRAHLSIENETETQFTLGLVSICLLGLAVIVTIVALDAIKCRWVPK